MIFWQCRCICEIICTIVCIRIDQTSALFQHPNPLFISPVSMRQCPCQVTGNHHIKALISKFRIFCIHHHKTTASFGNILTNSLFQRQKSGPFYHIRSQVHTSHLMAFFRQQDTEKSCSASDIQNLQRALCRQKSMNLIHPAFRLYTVQFCPLMLHKVIASFAPVTGHSLLCLYLRLYCLNHKHRCRCIIQLLFLTPYRFPDLLVNSDLSKANTTKNFCIPHRSVDR